MTGNTLNSANSLLSDYQKRGAIKIVRQNLYVAVDIYSDTIIPTRYEIASNIAEGAYITHHSAFEYYGYAKKTLETVYVSGKNRFNAFEFEGVDYKYFAERISDGVVETENGVRVTDIERTILDGINDFEKIAGLEELLRCIALIPYADENKLISYLKSYNKQVLWQKAGYVLSHFKDDLRLSDKFFTECETHIGKSVRYLYKGIQIEDNLYDKRWHLFVPQDLLWIINGKSLIKKPTNTRKKVRIPEYNPKTDSLFSEYF
jgi:predicted transcriptional regulator of viral defense system